jgi:Ca2+-binding RTX toxin-like protein
MSAGSGVTVRDGLIAIQSTNSGLNTYLGARVYVGGDTATSDTIAVDLNATTNATTFGIVYGNGGADQIFGSTGNDYLFGGDGNDTIEGGGGADSLTGGNGADVFVLGNVNTTGIDKITDFNWDFDKIDLSVNVTYYNNIGDITAGLDWATALNFAASQNGSPTAFADDSWDVIDFIYDGGRYLLVTIDENTGGTLVGSNTYNAATDILVEITGISGNAPYIGPDFGELPRADAFTPFI